MVLRNPAWLFLGLVFVGVIVTLVLFGFEAESIDNNSQDGFGVPPQTHAPSGEGNGTPPPTQKPSDPAQQQQEVKCDTYYDCKTDRISHLVPLYHGQAICNHNYMMGLTLDGILQWQDCTSNETHVFYHRNATNSTISYFMMKPDASWNVFNHENQTLFTAECKHEVHVYPTCLSHPVMDCPYLHLHRDGAVVLNWIDDDGEWMDRNIHRVYPDLVKW